MPIIEVENVSKRYPVRGGARAMLGRGGIGDWLRGRARETFEALRDINLSIDAGESVGIIGSNGSGKSTLLKLLAGVSLPSTGRVRVQGRVASLLELGAGFHPVLTGRENVYLNAGLLGMRHAQVDAVFDQIVAFSEIGEFIDQPVETYSSGMYVRIAFSVAVHTNPDIFLVDEVLAVGDESFQRKCRTKIGELREQGKTIVFVSHDLGIVSALCNRVLLLSRGEMLARATPQDTIQYYLRQAGRQSGVHTMRLGEVECVFSHGRIAVYLAGREVTAAGGLSGYLCALGYYHALTDAEWVVGLSEDARMEASGRMYRLPIVLHFEAALEADTLRYAFRATFEQATTLEQASCVLCFPASYERWQYGDRRGDFPETMPAHTLDISVAPAERGCLTAAFLPRSADGLPIALVAAKAGSHACELTLSNGSYMAGDRKAGLYSFLPADTPFAVGDELRLPEVSVRLLPGEEALAAWREEQEAHYRVRAGALTARLAPGCIELEGNGAALSAGVHLHTQLRFEGLWMMSQGLHWERLAGADGVLRAQGASARLPIRQAWELWAEGGAVHARFVLEADGDITLDEYNVSVGVVSRYTDWSLGEERGAFPAFTPGEESWTHVNQHYRPGQEMACTGAGLPGLRFTSAASAVPGVPSALNTGASQGLRVLQALYLPAQAGGLFFSRGKHELAHFVVALD